jgi:hypothetical protein
MTARRTSTGRHACRWLTPVTAPAQQDPGPHHVAAWTFHVRHGSNL